ncbi:MAG: M56 family metallopeptidase [Gemmataceae bacterium]|nr:M56 family metallopeptidase [Gemmataceae bacterium]MCI0742272.1 M56 family metallopeptidase [Gemmataceae bacterium]
MTVEILNSWSLSVTALGVAILWQSALVAALVGGTCFLLRRSSPALRYWCWQIVALKLLVMPWWILAVPLPSFFGHNRLADPTAAALDGHDNHKGSRPIAVAKNSGAPAAGIVQVMDSERTHGLDHLGQVSWQSWFVVAWLGGIIWQAAWLLVQRIRLRRFLSHTVAATEPQLLAQVDEAAALLGLRKPPAVVFADVEGSPFVCGLFRPRLVLPRGLLSALDANQWRQVLLHELAHLKRRDLLWGWIPEIARMIYFFHPVAHWVCFRIRLERELACDQLAMTLSGQSAADYALVLVEVVSRASMPTALNRTSTSVPNSHPTSVANGSSAA